MCRAFEQSHCANIFCVYIKCMKRGPDLEWDEAKRQATLTDRAVDFADVSALDWDSALTREDNRQGEPRFVTLGAIHGRLHVLAWCWRGEYLRLISLRKANAREVAINEQS